MGQRERRIHRQWNLGARDVGPMCGGTRARADDVRVRDSTEDDRAVGDDFHRRLRCYGGDRGDLRDVPLQELAHDERESRDVALRVALDECDGDVADEAGVGERFVEAFARFVERWER